MACAAHHETNGDGSPWRTGVTGSAWVDRGVIVCYIDLSVSALLLSLGDYGLGGWVV